MVMNMSTCRKIASIIILISILLIPGFWVTRYSNVQVGPLSDNDCRECENGAVIEHDESSLVKNGRSTRDEAVFFEGFEDGEFLEGKWHAENGWSVSNQNPRTGTYRANGAAEANNRKLTLTQDINLIGFTGATIIVYQRTVETEAQDLYFLEVSGNSGTNWTVLKSWNGDQLKDHQQFNRYQYDISQYDWNPNFRIRFRFSSSSNQEYWAIDDVEIRADPIIMVDQISISATPNEIYRYNGSTNITGDFLDRTGHDPYEYKVTISVRDEDSDEHILVDNQTSGFTTLRVRKINDNRFNFYYNWTPDNNIPFGPMDIGIIVWRFGVSGNVRFDDNEGNVTVLSYSPYLEGLPIHFEKTPVNVMDHRGLYLNITFHDIDEQSVDDYYFTLLLIGEDQNITVLDNKKNDTELILSRQNLNYMAEYVWTPSNPEQMDEGNYSLLIIINESGQQEIDNTLFNISQSVQIVKKYVPMIMDITCSCDSINLTGDKPFIIETEINDPDAIDPSVFTITVKIRDEMNRTWIILENISSDYEGLTISKVRAGDWHVELSIDLECCFPDGYYDLFFGISDGDSDFNFQDFDENTDILFIYNNTSPEITLQSISKTLMNIYGDEHCDISFEFLDIDTNDVEEFTILIQFEDEEGGSSTIFNSESFNENETLQFLTNVNNSTFRFHFSFDPSNDFEPGSYSIIVNVGDIWLGNHTIVMDQELELFFNAHPSAPSNIYPRFTTQVMPLISWWGALDDMTPYDELTYEIQIGLTSGDNTILAWYSTGTEAEYQIEKVLDTGEYHIQVRCSDGEYRSEIKESLMAISLTGNQPPSMPGPISPIYTIERQPVISWEHSSDLDLNSVLTYFIQIGSDWHGNEILSWTETSTHNFYKLPFRLSYGTFYVQVMASDGEENSPVREQTIQVLDPSKNIKPFAPNIIELLPEPNIPLDDLTTYDTTPTIKFYDAEDLNGDDVYYWIQIGNASDNGNILPWTYLAKETVFTIDDILIPGDYYIQLKSYDGDLYSDVYHDVMTIIPVPNIRLPIYNGPTFTTDTKPVLNWTAAKYTDPKYSSVPLEYEIRLVSDDDNSQVVLDWTHVKNPPYTIKQSLPGNTTYRIEIRADDGIVKTDLADPAPRIHISVFNIVVGFEVPNYLYEFRENSPNSIVGYAANYGDDDLKIKLKITGPLSDYIYLEKTTLNLSAGNVTKFSLSLNSLWTNDVEEDDMYIVMWAESMNGSRVSSEELNFKSSETEKEDWVSSLGSNIYLILAGLILLLTLIILLVLILKRRKKSKEESRRLDSILKEKDNELLLPPEENIYMVTASSLERISFESVNNDLDSALKKYKAQMQLRKREGTPQLASGALNKDGTKALPQAPAPVKGRASLPPPPIKSEASTAPSDGPLDEENDQPEGDHEEHIAPPDDTIQSPPIQEPEAEMDYLPPELDESGPLAPEEEIGHPEEIEEMPEPSPDVDEAVEEPPADPEPSTPEPSSDDHDDAEIEDEITNDEKEEEMVDSSFETDVTDASEMPDDDYEENEEIKDDEEELAEGENDEEGISMLDDMISGLSDEE